MAVPQSFPAKIYQILENESPEIIQWNENGLSFRIVDHSRFEREIVPKYFRHNQISSVQRQLNLYGFKCISRGEYKRSFFHPKFKRGDWETVRKLTRYIPVKKSTGCGDREEGQPPTPIPGAAPPAAAAAPQGSNIPTRVPYMYPYGNLPPTMHSGFPPSGSSAWAEPAWSQNARSGGSSSSSSGGSFAVHPLHHPGVGQPHGMPVYLPPGARTSELSGRLGFAHWPLPQGPIGFPQINMPTDSASNNAPQIKAPAPVSLSVSAPSAACASGESSRGSGSKSVSPEDTPRSAAHTHEPSSATLHHDYDLMMEFGVFDNFPLTELHTATAVSNLPVVMLPSPRQAHHGSDAAALFTTVTQPTAMALAIANASATVPVRSTPPSAVATPSSDAGPATPSTASRSTAAEVSQSGKGGIDVGCNTELTYDAATNSFVLRGTK